MADQKYENAVTSPGLFTACVHAPKFGSVKPVPLKPGGAPHAHAATLPPGPWDTGFITAFSWHVYNAQSTIYKTVT